MNTQRLGAALAALLVLAPSASTANVSNDQVQSQHLREADGSTGQNTNLGSGVKTGHIQDGAVTSQKLAPAAVGADQLGGGAVTTEKLADGAVTGAKIAPGSIGAAQLAPASVGTGAIGDGAVTPEKLSGLVPAAKIDRTGLDADSLDGYQAGDFSPIGHDHVLSEVQGSGSLRKKTRNVIVVSKDGNGDFTNPNDAFSVITDASAENPYLIKIEPGVYDVEGFGTRQYVDIEGSGEGVTLIRTSEPNTTHFDVQLYGPAEVRGLTIEMTDGKGAVTLGVRLKDVTLIRHATLTGWGWAVVSVYRTTSFDNVTLIGDAPTAMSGVSGVGLALYAPAIMRHSDVSMSGVGSAFGVYMFGMYTSADPTELELFDTSVRAEGTSQAWGITTFNRFDARGVRVHAETSSTGNAQTVAVMSGNGPQRYLGSELTATTAGTGLAYALQRSAGAGGSVGLANTMVGGPIQNGTGTPLQCVGTFDASFAPVACP